MQTLEQQLEDLDEKIKQVEVLPDEFANWKTHKVTKRFLLETQYAMLTAIEMDESGGPVDSVGRVALQATYKKAMKETFELILTWDPEDFTDN